MILHLLNKKRRIAEAARRLILLAAGFILCNEASLGQIPYSPHITEPLNDKFRWRQIEILSGKGVRCMVEDNEGHMWFGLDKGLARYNGYNLDLFDNLSFLKTPVTVLFRTGGGKLFAGSEMGLLGYDGSSWKKIFPTNDTLRAPVTCITEIGEGCLVAGIPNGLICLTANKPPKLFTTLAGSNNFRELYPNIDIYILPDEILFQRNFGRVDDIFRDDDGMIWLFLSRNNVGKLLKFRIADTLNKVLYKFEIFEEIGGHKLANRSKILKSGNGELWIINGFYKSGILHQKKGKWELVKLSDMFGGDELHTDIAQMTDGSIWVGGLGKLFVFNKGRWNVFNTPATPIPSSRIFFHESLNGNIWLAGIQSDVFRLNNNDRRWVKYHGLNFQFNAETGREYYISNEGMVVVNDKGRWYAYDKESGLIDAPVRCIASPKGRIWVAGSHHGIAATAYLEGNAWIVQTHPQLSWGIDARSVFLDNEGTLWFGASVDRQEALGQLSGVLRLLNPDENLLRWKHYTSTEGIAQQNAYGIGQSPDGSIWLGGTNLLQLEKLRWMPLKNNEFLNDYVDIVHSRENLWVGSRYYGIFRYDGNSWVQYSTHDGLPSNTIISIFEQSPSKVWVITDKNIACFDGQRWFSGMFSDELRIPREGGEIFVDAQGAVRINKSLREWKRRAFQYSITPAKVMEEFWTIKYIPDNHPPQSSILISTEKVDKSGNTLLGWGGHDFWEETPTQKLTYSHRLDDGDWSVFSTQTSLVLSNLKSGRHTFELRARDSDFNIEFTPTRISFSVAPPIWKQTWFIVLVLAFLLIISFYEWRVLKRNRTLAQLNKSLGEVNKTLESRQKEIEYQNQTITKQKWELEKKTSALEEMNLEISMQRDKLKEMVEQIEELSNLKQRLFTNISHEFRTPLTLIMGSVERLLAFVNTVEKNTLKPVTDTIQRNSRRLLNLINQILEIRKMESGSVELSVKTGDIVCFCREIVVLFSDLANNQTVELVFESNTASQVVLFDQDKIEKILFNLVSNAFKHTPAGGRITIRLQTGVEQLKHPSLEPAPSEPLDQVKIVFEVSDTGEGIHPDDLPRIFDRFFSVRGDKPPASSDGLGIGLSYVKDLVTSHQGYIDVQSQLNTGTVFRVEIPFTRAQAATTDSTNPGNQFPAYLFSGNIKAELETLSNELINIEQEKGTFNDSFRLPKPKTDKLIALVVEDDSEIRALIGQMLEPDFEVIDARNGVIGYQKAVDYQPDIIITDIMMPVMNGIELCKKIKTNFVTSHIPVILLTARSEPELKLEGYQTGADAFIEKPFSAEYLRVRISNLLLAKEKTREKVIRELITQPSAIEAISENDKMLRKLQMILEENIANPDFDVENMSQMFFLSRFHFSRKVKQVTGLTPKEIIDSYRLKRAGQLLQQKLAIAEVAYLVGFDHPNSFSRAFRKYYNMTPSEFAGRKE